LCCPQRIRCSLSNLCHPNLPNLCCLQWIRCSLPNCVFRSESAFAAKVVLSAAEVWFAVEIELPVVN
jgi:hypothetical protein